MTRIKYYLAANAAVALFAAFTIISTVIGGVRHYSPIPFWDMWDGALAFYLKAEHGDLAAWWAQHNEHRIVLARLLFWIDYRWFSGDNIFLIAINYVLTAVTVAIFLKIVREYFDATRTPGAPLLGFFLCAWLFQWMQIQNLTWAFQSQFFLAQLLPLFSFYALWKSSSGVDVQWWFIIACVLGVASVGTMANGVMVLPLMALGGILFRFSRKRIVVILLLSIIVLIAYFHGYAHPAQHASASDAIRQPVNLTLYVLRYLGNPFFYLGGERFGRSAATIAGAILVITSIWLFTRRQCNPISNGREPELTLLFFIAYIGLTAVITATGRLNFGLDQALSSRYTTPSLMAWAAIFILVFPIFVRIGGKWCPVAIVFVCCVLMTKPQLKAMRSFRDVLHERETAALALSLQINDVTAIEKVFYNPTIGLALADAARNDHLSIFAQPPYLVAGNELGTQINYLGSEKCQGYVDVTEPIASDRRFVRLRGWLFHPNDPRPPALIRFANASGTIVGFGIQGMPRVDVKHAIGKAALNTGFHGYLKADEMGKDLRIINASGACEFVANIPFLPFIIKDEELMASRASVTSANILHNDWSGTDYYRTSANSMKVYGSYIKSDQDIGSMTIRVHKGDTLFYRSGPTANGQYIEIDGRKTQMPGPALNWVLLAFDAKQIPPQGIVVTFSDEGTHYGEWSAIALKD